jgi:hypothetical protein
MKSGRSFNTMRAATAINPAESSANQPKIGFRTAASDIANLQVFYGQTSRNLYRFTRERSLVRAQPRPWRSELEGPGHSSAYRQWRRG